jgi:hypothetical protein
VVRAHLPHSRGIELRAHVELADVGMRIVKGRGSCERACRTIEQLEGLGEIAAKLGDLTSFDTRMRRVR